MITSQAPLNRKNVSLDDLGTFRSIVSSLAAGHYIECCMFCLDSNKHSSGVLFHNNYHNTVIDWDLTWNGQLSLTQKAAHTDTKQTVEWAAICIAVLLIHHESQDEILRQSAKGSGFDYFLLPKSTPTNNIFYGGTPIEISGIQTASASNTSTNRIALKRKRLKNNNVTNAKILVVEFGQPESITEAL